ncbi:MAG TPA: tetratricopeptide repeat protein [Bacteroidales bacterium]|nr:tetratricopeptide repeat protein [Bacteroidales bacterium]
MGKIKIILAGFLVITSGIQLLAQSAAYEKTIEGFQNSYLSEATGDLSQAIQQLKDIYDEDSYEINLRLGWLTYSAGQFTDSYSYYNRALSLRPFAIEPRFGLIYPAAAMGNWDVVIKQYNQIIETAPGNTIAMHRLGLVYYGRKEYDKAEKLFEKVINLYPFDYDALSMLAWTKYQLKKYREAKVLFNKALMNTPGGQSAIDGLELLE